MALVTDYNTLQAHIADVLNRSDLSSVIPNFIQQFESRAKVGIETSPGVMVTLRKLSDRRTYNVSDDHQSLPSDYGMIDSWYHDGPDHYGVIEIVTPNQIGEFKRQRGAALGRPCYAALSNRNARFYPEPDQTYATTMTYYRIIENLSATNTTNWLLTDAPDLYLYGALVESAPYLKDDSRISLWESQLRTRAQAFDAAQQDEAIGAAMNRTYSPFGG